MSSCRSAARVWLATMSTAGSPASSTGSPDGPVPDGALGALAERMGMRLVESSAERVVGTMPVEGNTQPFGLLHGGASCVLAETLGSIAASTHAAELFG